MPLLLAVGALAGLGKLSLGWALLAALGARSWPSCSGTAWAAAGATGAPRVAVVGRAFEYSFALRLRAVVIGKYFFAVNAAMAALAGSAGIGVTKFLVYD